MDKLINKLNYKGQQRIVLINPDNKFFTNFQKELKNVQIDREIDPRYLYEFMLIFTDTIKLVEEFSPAAIHNLAPDGILWFAFPLKSSDKFSSGPDRNNGWKSLNNLGFKQVRQININTDYSALRFRNVKFIKSSKIATD